MNTGVIRKIKQFQIDNWFEQATFQQQAWLFMGAGESVWVAISAGIVKLMWITREFYPAGALATVIGLLLLLGFVFYRAASLCLDLVGKHLDEGVPLELKSWWHWGVAQFLIILAVSYVFFSYPRPEDLVCVLLLLVTPQLALFVSFVRAFLIIALACIPLIVMATNEFELTMYISYVVLHAIFIGFIHCIMSVQRTKEQLIQSNQKLLDAQLQLATNVKHEERLRIARDLHDRVGHHLTALSIQLEVTKLMSEGELQEEIQKSQRVAKTLLADVREVVGEFRDQSQCSFDGRVRELIANLNQIVPQVDIRLVNTVTSNGNDQHSLDALFLSIQELLTNALKHGSPSIVDIRVDRKNDAILMDVSDNGRENKRTSDASCSYAKGNGLKGIEERMHDLNGSFVTEISDRGFSAHISIPA